MNTEMWTRAGAACVMVSLVVTACGAKTELRAPSVEVCNVGALTLPHSEVEAMLVIDRSGSMNESIPGAGYGTSRWEAMRDSLTSSLPAYDQRISLGLWMFPAPGSRECFVGTEPVLEPARDNVADIVAALQVQRPEGSTPTYEAVRAAGEWLPAHGAPGAVRALVLATDGQPNCGVSEDATIRGVADVAAQGIPVYVIGIEGQRSSLTTVLDELAVAGGRPRGASSARQYYSVQRREDLTAAFDAIQSMIAECSRVAPLRPSGDTDMSVESNGAPFTRDPAHRDGWDWADATSSTMIFYGPACERLAHGAVTVTVRYGCR